MTAPNYSPISNLTASPAPKQDILGKHYNKGRAVIKVKIFIVIDQLFSAIALNSVLKVYLFEIIAF